MKRQTRLAAQLQHTGVPPQGLWPPRGPQVDPGGTVVVKHHILAVVTAIAGSALVVRLAPICLSVRGMLTGAV